MKTRGGFVLFFSVLAVVMCRMALVDADIEHLNSNNISYEQTIQPIIESNCLSCHSGKKPAAGMLLTNYDEVRYQTEHGDLLNRINDKRYPMPKGGLMPKRLRRVIAQWAESGYQEKAGTDDMVADLPKFTSPNITPVNIQKAYGFEFMDLMQGHWQGDLNIMGESYEWFSFDYRPVSAAHIHGIHEGGSMGNIFTSFFITNFKGKRTIVARNGGVLNGIYRTSYFVLDKAEEVGNQKYFRFVDAVGGQDIMWMELIFTDNKLAFNSYTSRFGMNGKAKRHMTFKGEQKNLKMAYAAAKLFDYPKDTMGIDFVKDFILPMPLFIKHRSQNIPWTTASYTAVSEEGTSLEELGKMAGDPILNTQIPHLASLQVNVDQNSKIKAHDLIVYLSKERLTDDSGEIILEYGYISPELFESVCSSPVLIAGTDSFTFNYLHPDEYYLTIVGDANQDGYISKGDITSKSILLKVAPLDKHIVDVGDVVVEN